MCCRRNKVHPESQATSTELDFLQEVSEHNPGVFKEACFFNSRGLKLRAYVATPSCEVLGVVIMHHGIRAHGLFESLCTETMGGRQTCLAGSIAEFFLDQGFIFYTYDCEGHGLSESQFGRTFFSNAWDLVADLVQFGRIVSQRHPEIQPFLCGLSLGGGICVGAGISEPSLFRGLVLGAPMISIEQLKRKGANRCLIVVAPPLLRRCSCVSRWRLVAMEKNGDPMYQKTFAEDPLTDGKNRMLAGPAFACLLYCIDLVKRLEELSLPVITMHARAYTIVDFESSTHLMERAASTDKLLLEAPEGSGHGLYREDASREWTQQVIREWLMMRA